MISRLNSNTIPRLVVKKGKLIVQGNFEFKVKPGVVVTENQITAKEASFQWCPEVSVELHNKRYEEQVEIFAEKLKQDFIKFFKK
jgi:hypothetical protein